MDKIELIAETFLYGIVSGERKEKEEAGRSEVPQEV